VFPNFAKPERLSEPYDTEQNNEYTGPKNPNFPSLGWRVTIRSSIWTGETEGSDPASPNPLREHLMGESKGQHFCLFTGEPLDETTREEHTIPRSLGGRVRSRIVSSTKFNNECSGIDEFLFQVYAEMMVMLGPKLSSEHRAGQLMIDIPGDPKKFVLDENGSVQLKGVTILASDPLTKKPKLAISDNPKKLQKLLKQTSGSGAEATYSSVSMNDSDHFFRSRWEMRPEIELSALKSVLLTFDHLLAASEQRFTRSPDLEDVRKFVEAAIRTEDIDPVGFHRFSLGIQYESIPTIEKLRAEIDPPPAEFEHIMVASGNSATKTLDAVWLIAGIDPFGFRLSRNWNGGDFTCTIINQMLYGGGGVFGPFWRGLPKDLCVPNNRRSFHKYSTPEKSEAMMDEISGRRMMGFRRAVRLVERECDEALIAKLAEIALTDFDGGKLVKDALHFRLGRLYFKRLEEAASRLEFERIVSEGFTATPLDIVDQAVRSEAEKELVSWSVWLEIYRGLLARLETAFGPPGDMFVNRSARHVDQERIGRVGKSPIEFK
jgi:hypothetical protein